MGLGLVRTVTLWVGKDCYFMGLVRTVTLWVWLGLSFYGFGKGCHFMGLVRTATLQRAVLDKASCAPWTCWRCFGFVHSPRL